MGFLKGGISSSSSTNFINGKMSSSQSIIQNYIAKQEGVFEIPSFEINVNNQKIDVRGKKITVTKSLVLKTTLLSITFLIRLMTPLTIF